jgi:SAM-dependent methyltransferase
MSFPYFISPEQAMRERSELARKGIARGRSVVALAYSGGVLFVAENPSRVLDLGCGEGWLVRSLSGHPALAGTRIVGVDAVPDLVARARAADQDGQYHLASYADLSRRPDLVGVGFDVIAANFSLLDDKTAPLLTALAGIAAPGARLIIQTLHPAMVGGPYRDGWRTESFAAFGSTESWAPMPWYFRTVGSWIDTLSPHWHLRTLAEPLHPDTERPASLLLTAATHTG